MVALCCCEDKLFTEFMFSHSLVLLRLKHISYEITIKEIVQVPNYTLVLGKLHRKVGGRASGLNRDEYSSTE